MHSVSIQNTPPLCYTCCYRAFIPIKMKLKTRTTHAFVEIKVDEIETTVFKSNPKEIEDMINNLLDVVNDLASYTNKSVSDYVSEGGF